MVRIFGHYVSSRVTVFIVIEFFVLCWSVALGAVLRFSSQPNPLWKISGLWWKVVVFALVWQFAFFLADLYKIDTRVGRKVLMIKTALASAGATLVLTVCYYLVPPLYLGRGVLFIASAVAAGAAFSLRLLYFWMYSSSKYNNRVLIFGTGSAAKMITDVLINGYNPGYDLMGFLDPNDEAHQSPSSSGPVEGKTYYNGEDVFKVASAEGVTKIIVSPDNPDDLLPLNRFLDCKFSGIEVLSMPAAYEQLTGKILIHEFLPNWLVFTDGFRTTPASRAAKVITDYCIALLGLILAAPLMALIALAIKLDSRGPIFYTQERVGKNQRPFRLIKFRTMAKDAEAASGPVWAQPGDPRVTTVGRFLRRTRLDEIPQFINVLKGEMSIVGPRPERPHFVAQLQETIPFYNQRHTVKPGVTGWAQTQYPYGASEEDALEKLQYDLYYIKNISLFLDLLTLLATIRVVLTFQGGR